MRFARNATVFCLAVGFFYLVAGSGPESRGAQRGAKTGVPEKTGVKTAAKTAKKSGGPTSPLGRLIRGLIPTGNNKPLLPKRPRTGKISTDPATARSELMRARDHIDSRAPHDPDDVKRFRRAKSLVAAGEWESAMRVIQLLLDRTDDSVTRTGKDEWVSVREQANRLLGTFPEQFRKSYRLRYGAAARVKLDDALKAGDLKSVAEIATRYFHTKAGADAAGKLCAIYLERGEYGVAARWYARLLDSKLAVKDDPRWLLQAAYAFHRAGDKTESDRLVAKLQELQPHKTVMIGGRPVRPANWLKSLPKAVTGPQRVSEWRTLFGNASRTATLSGGEPLLLARWKKPITNSYPIRRHIERLLETLTDNRRALIPATIPLTVNGKVIYRTLRGVNIVDAETGELQWESREGISAERLLSGMPASTNYNSRLISRRMSSTTQAYGDHHPLTGLMFRNGNYGLLSSDGERLFVIEDQALLPGMTSYGYMSDPEQNDKYRRSWLTNKLTAYDLKTGRPLWEVGGRKRTESFDLPLAGNYFLGVPVAQGGELFVVGEQDSRVRLHVIDVATGKAKWSRLIAYSDAKISQDPVRRWFTAQVALADGVVICPTSVGWLVAVDRTNRSILWAQRYSKPQSSSRTMGMPSSTRNRVPQVALNQRWIPSAPVITGGHVVYTPQEHESIVCLRARDGKRVWQIPKGDYLYLAGVFGDKVVLVGKQKITAVRLREGTTAWSQPIDKSAGYPSGMGVAAGDRYHVPLHNGQLWTLDVATGKILSKLYLPQNSRPLGNLTMYRGQVLSLTPHGLTSFEQRAALFAKIAERKKRSPKDAWAALKEAEVALLKRDFQAALKFLRNIDPKTLPPREKPRYRMAMLRSLTAAVRSDFKAHDVEAQQLEKFVSTPNERFQHRRLTAERFDARGQFSEAFASYRQLAQDDGDRTIVRQDNRRLEIQLRAWTAGKMRDLWNRMSPEMRNTVAVKLVADAKTIATRPLADRLRFARLFAFHPVAVTVTRGIVEQADKAGNFARAEQLLLGLRQHPDVVVAASATERLARLLRSRKLHRDGNVVYAELARKHGSVKLADGRTAAKLVADLQLKGTFGPKAVPKPVSWGMSAMRIEQSGSNYQSYPDQGLLVGRNRFPYFRDHSFQIDHSQQQLVVTRVSDDSLAWLVPLRGQQKVSNQYTYGASFGHFVLVMNRNVLHCLSPVDRRVVWTRPLENRSPNRYLSYYSSSPTRNRYRPMQDGSQVAATYGLSKSFSQQGGLAFANAKYVGAYGRRRLQVLDAATGDVVWTLRGIAQGSKVVATENTVFVLNNGGDPVVVLRAQDGRKLSTAKAPQIAAKAVGIDGNALLVPDSRTSNFLGLRRSTTTWKLQDPITGKTLWKRQYASGTSFSILDDGNIVALSRKGSLEVIDRSSGAVSTFPVTGTELRKSRQIYVVSDRNTLFVVANNGSRSTRYYSYGGLTTISVSGDIYAFDRATRKRLWKKTVSNQQLVMDHFDLSPVLAFNTRTYVNRGLISHQTLSLQAIDKRSGKTLIDKKIPSNQYYGSFRVNLRDRYVEFRTYSHRLRLVAVKGSKPPAEAKRPTE